MLVGRWLGSGNNGSIDISCSTFDIGDSIALLEHNRSNPLTRRRTLAQTLSGMRNTDILLAPCQTGFLATQP